MPNDSDYGVFSSHQLYTLDGLARKANKPRAWVRNTFIRPVDPKTKKRLLDPRTGQPLAGVRHVALGWECFIAGQDLINWIAEHGVQEEE